MNLHLARLDREDGRPVEAERRLRHILTVDPQDLDVQFELSQALSAQGRTDEARAVIKQSDKQRAELEIANKLLREEAEHPSSDPNKLSAIGVILLEIGQEIQGVYWLEQALVHDPKHQPAHKALAAYFERKGEVEKSALHRRQIVDPDSKASRP